MEEMAKRAEGANDNLKKGSIEAFYRYLESNRRVSCCKVKNLRLVHK